MSLPTALLVVDVQHDFVHADPPPHDPDAMIAALTTLLDAARAAGALVVHVRDVGDADSRFPPGSPGRRLVLEPAPGEPVVDKEHDDAFVGTDLADLLAGHEAVVVGGLQSEMCVSATARGVLARGLRLVLPHDAHSTYDVPAGPAGPAIPGEVVRRVAAWALGDEVELPLHAADVRFAAGPGLAC
ncbi:cysteine hydrolase family protein [Nocardioides litoris]|uniref:cysteine hydrolase family protein n=1 Tax=Nocardioides litoris TaxID=1926648 RepID=UPI001B87CA38|nr:cysteine hydrolase family protein [Nocardioides litoris]